MTMTQKKQTKKKNANDNNYRQYNTTRHVKLDKDIDETCTHKFSMENTVYCSAITNLVMAKSVRLSDNFNLNHICTSVMSPSKR